MQMIQPPPVANDPATCARRRIPTCDTNSNVSDYYRETIEDYQTWSRQGYMHFGMWRPGMNPFNRRAMLEAMNDEVFQSLFLSRCQGLDVGDLGCGLGAVSQYGSDQFPSHHWHAVTNCPAQVEYGHARVVNERVSIHCADYNELPFDVESLDAAFFLESLCHSDRLSATLTEVARVLKPGGNLVVVDGFMRKPAARTPGYANKLARIVASNWAVGEFHSVPDFQQAAAGAGFNIRSCRELGWKIAASVAHSPLLVGWHTIKLIIDGKWSRWKRRHMIGCAAGIMLGLLRGQFGYYLFSLQKTV